MVGVKRRIDLCTATHMHPCLYHHFAISYACFHVEHMSKPKAFAIVAAPSTSNLRMKDRAIADPRISVGDLEKAIHNGLQKMGIRDLDQILDAAHEQTAWRATPRIEHLAPVAPFVFELLGPVANGVAPTETLKMRSLLDTRLQS